MRHAAHPAAQEGIHLLAVGLSVVHAKAKATLFDALQCAAKSACNCHEGEGVRG